MVMKETRSYVYNQQTEVYNAIVNIIKHIQNKGVYKQLFIWKIYSLLFFRC